MTIGADVPGKRPAVLEVFEAGGAVGRDLAAVDWAATPLGPPQSWPQSLVSVVRVLLTSRFSMWMAWGPELTFFCNDAYRRDTLGRKYPWALGRPAREVWAEIWPEIGPRIDRVMATGEATWDEALLLFLERSGYREETYHTFSYSPLMDDDGKVVGMLCVVSEDTERVIGDPPDGDGAGRRRQCHGAAQRGGGARRRLLAARRGPAVGALGPGLPVRSRRTGRRLDRRAVGVRGRARRAPGRGARGRRGRPGRRLAGARRPGGAHRARRRPAGPVRPDVPAGAWPEPPLRALAVPLRQQDDSRPAGFVVVALNRYRALDADYQGFVELLADQISSALAGARAYQEERERAERLLELDRAKTEFFTNVSHEFRTPLTLLLGPAEDALVDTGNPLDDVQRQRFELVRRNGERLLRLVNTLLDFSRLEDGHQPGRFEPVDLAQYTAELAGTFSVAIERAGLTLTVDCAPLPSPVLIDREMWAKIVLNLLSNALKFTFSGGITVRLRASRRSAGRRGRAGGRGHRRRASRRAQAKLFTRFSRVAGAASRSHEGSGIGLALVSDLAAAHGGRVAVRSVPAQGSTFTVAVPLGRDHLPADQVLDAAGDDTDGAEVDPPGARAASSRRPCAGAPTPRQPARVRPTAPTTAGRRVLVADDNADMRDYIVGCSRGRTTCSRRATGCRRSSSPGPTPPTSCSAMS